MPPPRYRTNHAPATGSIPRPRATRGLDRRARASGRSARRWSSCLRDLVDLRPDARHPRGRLRLRAGRDPAPRLPRRARQLRRVRRRPRRDRVVPGAPLPAEPGFHFHHADVANDTYNPKVQSTRRSTGSRSTTRPSTSSCSPRCSPTSSTTPPSGTSTRSRACFGPAGRLFSTWFLLDGVSIGAVMRGEAEIPFQPAPGPVWTMDAAQPAWAVAYDETFVRDLFSDTPLAIDAVVHGHLVRTTGRSQLPGHRRRAQGSVDDRPPPRKGARELEVRRPPRAVRSQLRGARGRSRSSGGTSACSSFGCSFGYVSEALPKRGCRRHGYRDGPGSGRAGRRVLRRVVVGDLDTIDLPAELGDARFDVALFGDVLEHLRDPVAVLRQIASSSPPRATSSRASRTSRTERSGWRSCRSDFEYRDLGLLDQTHIHLFTRHSIEEAFRDAGLRHLGDAGGAVGIFATEIPLGARTSPPRSCRPSSPTRPRSRTSSWSRP